MAELDLRVTRCTAKLNGQTYHYLLGIPKGDDWRGTIFLIHGWPDCSLGWRLQLPALLDLGLRVVVPDMMGYGRTDAPQVPPNPLSLYSLKRAADDIAELARQLGAPRIILGGHDWGGAVVFRVALWHPSLVTHLISVCTPYNVPSKTHYSLELIVKNKLPNFAYQLQLAGPEVESTIKGKDKIRQFLNAAYGGTGPNGEQGFNVYEGIVFENLPKLNRTPLMSAEELEDYTVEFARHGLHGPLNWYRCRELNFTEELSLTTTTLNLPVLFFQPMHDVAIVPKSSIGMERNVPNMTRVQLDAGHWALTQRSKEINTKLQEWFREVVWGGRSSL